MSKKKANKVKKTTTQKKDKKLNFDNSNCCVECIDTDKKGYKISLQLLEKIWSQSLSLSKKPLLIIGISKNDRERFLLQCNISIERK